jgi:hypothetical protein
MEEEKWHKKGAGEDEGRGKRKRGRVIEIGGTVAGGGKGWRKACVERRFMKPILRPNCPQN